MNKAVEWVLARSPEELAPALVLGVLLAAAVIALWLKVSRFNLDTLAQTGRAQSDFAASLQQRVKTLQDLEQCHRQTLQNQAAKILALRELVANMLLWVTARDPERADEFERKRSEIIDR